MPKYLIHLDATADGYLPPDAWEEWEGDNPEHAIRLAIQKRQPIPRGGFYAPVDGPKREDGRPLCVVGFTLTLELSHA